MDSSERDKRYVAFKGEDIIPGGVTPFTVVQRRTSVDEGGMSRLHANEQRQSPDRNHLTRVIRGDWPLSLVELGLESLKPG